MTLNIASLIQLLQAQPDRFKQSNLVELTLIAETAKEYHLHVSLIQPKDKSLFVPLRRKQATFTDNANLLTNSAPTSA